MKGHSQLGHMRIRYRFIANLHVTIVVPRSSVSFVHVVGENGGRATRQPHFETSSTANENGMSENRSF